MDGPHGQRKLGTISFALLFVGFNLTFFPMHLLGYRGMPRRVYTYPAELHWGHLNMVASAGALVLGAGLLVMLADFIRSAREGALAGDNPWHADSLEWAAPSPHRSTTLPICLW